MKDDIKKVEELSSAEIERDKSLVKEHSRKYMHMYGLSENDHERSEFSDKANKPILSELGDLCDSGYRCGL